MHTDKKTIHVNMLRSTPMNYMKYVSIPRSLKNWIIISFSTILPPGSIKNKIICLTGAKIHKSVCIPPHVIIDPLFPELVTIDKGVMIGWGVKIFAHIITPENKTLLFETAPVHIKSQAFIGAFSTIRSGVTIGKNAIVGSDSLVLKDIPDGKTAYGIPAKIKED